MGSRKTITGDELCVFRTQKNMGFKINFFEGSKVLEEFYDELNKKLFPNGKNQQKKEAQEIMKLSNGKLNFDESFNLLLGTTALFSVAEDKSENRMAEYINKKTNQKLNNEETKAILNFIISKFFIKYEGEN